MDVFLLSNNHGFFNKRKLVLQNLSTEYILVKFKVTFLTNNCLHYFSGCVRYYDVSWCQAIKSIVGHSFTGKYFDFNMYAYML